MMVCVHFFINDFSEVNAWKNLTMLKKKKKNQYILYVNTYNIKCYYCTYAIDLCMLYNFVLNILTNESLLHFYSVTQKIKLQVFNSIKKNFFFLLISFCILGIISCAVQVPQRFFRKLNIIFFSQTKVLVKFYCIL